MIGKVEAPPVEQPDLLLHIFSFLGSESYMFIASVSKLWKSTYGLFLAHRPRQTRVTYALENLCVLKYGKKNRLDWNAKIFALVCGTGDLGMVLWAVEEGIPRDDRALCCAARSGSLNVVQFLLQQQLILNSDQSYDVCAAAAAGGHLKVLKYLRDEGFAWDNVVTLEASYHGHKHILQYAKDNGCPWSPNACSVAAFNGHLDLLKVRATLASSRSIFLNVVNS